MAHHLHSNAPTNPHRVSQGLHASILRLQTGGVYGDQASQAANMVSSLACLEVFLAQLTSEEDLLYSLDRNAHPAPVRTASR